MNYHLETLNSYYIKPCTEHLKEKIIIDDQNSWLNIVDI